MNSLDSQQQYQTSFIPLRGGLLVWQPFGIVNHFTVKTHFYKKFISVYQLIMNIYQISRNIQALGHNPDCHPSPYGEGVLECANSNNNKWKVLHCSESENPCTQITQIVLNTDKLLYCLFSLAISYIHYLSIYSSLHITWLGWFPWLLGSWEHAWMSAYFFTHWSFVYVAVSDTTFIVPFRGDLRTDLRSKCHNKYDIYG